MFIKSFIFYYSSTEKRHNPQATPFPKTFLFPPFGSFLLFCCNKRKVFYHNTPFILELVYFLSVCASILRRVSLQTVHQHHLLLCGYLQIGAMGASLRLYCFPGRWTHKIQGKDVVFIRFPYIVKGEGGNGFCLSFL